MLRSALYEIAHDYAILGEDSLQIEGNENYQQQNDQTEFISEPIENRFQNFSKLLQAEKQKNQLKRALLQIDTNFVLHQSPKRVSTGTNCSGKHKSTYSSPKSFIFYDRQIRWLNQVRQTIKVKEEVQKQRESVECPFKPKKCSNKKAIVRLTENHRPTKSRKDSYSTIHLFNKK